MTTPLALVAPMLREGEKIYPMAAQATSDGSGDATFAFPQFNTGFRILAAFLATAGTTPGGIGTLTKNGNTITGYSVQFGLPLNDTALVGWKFDNGCTVGVIAAGLTVSAAHTLVLYFALPENC